MVGRFMVYGLLYVFLSFLFGTPEYKTPHILQTNLKREILAYNVAHVCSILKMQLQKHRDESPRQQPELD